MKKYILSVLITVFFFTAGIHSYGQICRGSSPGEVYMNCFWYYTVDPAIPYNGVFRSTDNGTTISVQDKYAWGGIMLSDSLAGTLYLYFLISGPDTIKISNDYGQTWYPQYTASGVDYVSGCQQGEIYKKSGDISNPGIFRSSDFGNSFICMNPQFIGDKILDVGSIQGELFVVRWDMNWDTLELKYSQDFGQTFTSIFVDTNIIMNSNFYGPPKLSHGTVPGEFYLIRLSMSDSKYYVFHTSDYGSTFTFQYTTQPCPTCYYDASVFTFTAGRAAGSFYIMRVRWGDTLTGNHSIMCIDYSQDYGLNYTTNCFELDSTFTIIKDNTQERLTSLDQNTPNPFITETTITWQNENTGLVNVSIYNVFGERIKALINSNFPPGKYSVIWDGKNDKDICVQAGIYFCQFRIDGKVIETKKMIVL